MLHVLTDGFVPYGVSIIAALALLVLWAARRNDRIRRYQAERYREYQAGLERERQRGADSAT